MNSFLQLMRSGYNPFQQSVSNNRKKTLARSPERNKEPRIIGGVFDQNKAYVLKRIEEAYRMVLEFRKRVEGLSKIQNGVPPKDKLEEWENDLFYWLDISERFLSKREHKALKMEMS